MADRALDAILYLPAGALLAALEDVPQTVAKGRARVDQELRNARLVGRFVVDFGWRQLQGQLQSLGTARPQQTEAPPVAPPALGREHRQEARQARGAGHAVSRDPDVDLAIPDYDILAASQVVRRLDGLGHDELRAVVRHERATRGRRTVLQRAEQLLGRTPHDPGPAGAPPGSDGRP